MTPETDRRAQEARFQNVFSHLGAVRAYARRRGSADPEAVAAEVMAVAWRRLADVPTDDARPWLFATARNLLLAEWRKEPPRRLRGPAPEVADLAPDIVLLEPEIARALRELSLPDREALLLVAWEDLSPKQAAQAVGIGEGAFRVRLHRARRRFRQALLGDAPTAGRHLNPTSLNMEGR
jgi:RNA polymerase sigma-70 factor, ECF subfamily